MPAVKKTKTAPAKKKTTKTAKKHSPAAAPTLDWSATIKKAAADKRSQANWPGSGDAWKKKGRM